MRNVLPGRRAECQAEPEDVPNEFLATHTKTLSSTPPTLVDQRALAPPVRRRLLVRSTTAAAQLWRALTTWPVFSREIVRSSTFGATARLRERETELSRKAPLSIPIRKARSRTG